MTDPKKAFGESAGEKDHSSLLKFHKETQHITIANSANSPLLRLPAKIREKIFRYPVTTNDGKIYLQALSHSTSPTTYHIINKEPPAVFLPQVCRQMFSECATCYAENTFYFTANKSRPDILNPICDTKPDLLRWIRRRSVTQRFAIQYIEMEQYDMLGLSAPQKYSYVITPQIQVLCPNIKNITMIEFRLPFNHY